MPKCMRFASESEQKLNEIGDAFGVKRRYTKYEDVLADPKVDAIHINTPIPDHAPQSLAGLKAGKHVACTVPMATTVEECGDRRAAADSGKNYMMMETVVYSREFLFVKQLYESGELGRIQFLRGHISRRWPVGPAIGKACRRCITPRTASAPACACRRSEAESVVVSSVRAGSAKS